MEPLSRLDQLRKSLSFIKTHPNGIRVHKKIAIAISNVTLANGTLFVISETNFSKYFRATSEREISSGTLDDLNEALFRYIEVYLKNKWDSKINEFKEIPLEGDLVNNPLQIDFIGLQGQWEGFIHRNYVASRHLTTFKLQIIDEKNVKCTLGTIEFDQTIVKLIGTDKVSIECVKRSRRLFLVFYIGDKELYEIRELKRVPGMYLDSGVSYINSGVTFIDRTQAEYSSIQTIDGPAEREVLDKFFESIPKDLAFLIENRVSYLTADFQRF